MSITAPALLANVLPRIVRILNANRDAWSQDVAPGQGSFPDNNEILSATLEADEHIVTRGYFNSVNRSLAEPFMQMTGNIPSGGKIPFHYGLHGKVELSSAANFSPLIDDIEQKNADDVKGAVLHGGYVGAGVFDNLYAIDDKKNFFHVAQYGRVEIPMFTRTSVLQANKSEETLIIATAIRFMNKHAVPVLFADWTKESFSGLEQIINDGAYQENAKLAAEARGEG